MQQWRSFRLTVVLAFLCYYSPAISSGNILIGAKILRADAAYVKLQNESNLNGTFPEFPGTNRTEGNRSNITGMGFGNASYSNVSSNVPQGSIRLVEVTTEGCGRVEIFYGNQWGSVCDDRWGDTDAGVVCRQLGFGGGSRTSCSSSGRGQAFGSFVSPACGTDSPIWMDEVDCSGFETSLGACNSAGWGVHDCWHGEDAGACCNMNSVCPEHAHWLDSTFPGELTLNLFAVPRFLWEIKANDPALLGNISQLRPTCRCDAGRYRSNGTCMQCPEFTSSPQGSLSIGECKCIQELCGNISKLNETCSPCADASEAGNSTDDSPATSYQDYATEGYHVRSGRISSSAAGYLRSTGLNRGVSPQGLRLLRSGPLPAAPVAGKAVMRRATFKPPHSTLSPRNQPRSPYAGLRPRRFRSLLEPTAQEPGMFSFMAAKMAAHVDRSGPSTSRIALAGALPTVIANASLNVRSWAGLPADSESGSRLRSVCTTPAKDYYCSGYQQSCAACGESRKCRKCYKYRPSCTWNCGSCYPCTGSAGYLYGCYSCDYCEVCSSGTNSDCNTCGWSNVCDSCYTTTTPCATCQAGYSRTGCTGSSPGTCSPCSGEPGPANSVWVPSNSAECAWACRAGYSLDGGVCVACAAEALPQNADFVAGSTSAACLWTCWAGRYMAWSTAAKSYVCRQCPAGKYAAAIASSCSTCDNQAPANAALLAGSTTSTCGWQCNAGYYRSAQHEGCKQCSDKAPVNAVQIAGSAWIAGDSSLFSAFDCLFACNAGYYKADSACVICPAGQYSVARALSCISCPSGKNTPPAHASLQAGSRSSVCVWKCDAGYYLSNSTCSACPSSAPSVYGGSFPGNKSDAPTNGAFLPGSTSSICRFTCDTGYFRNGSACSPCIPPAGAKVVDGPADQCSFQCNDLSCWDEMAGKCGGACPTDETGMQQPGSAFALGGEMKEVQLVYDQGIPADSLSDTGCGRLQVRYGGEWGEVCGDGWGPADARVVCSMLGLHEGTAGGSSTEAMPTDTVFWMYNVGCTGEESVLQSCASGRAGTAEQGRTVCPARLGARVCCVSAEQAYFVESYGEGDDADTVDTLRAMQDDAHSFAADIRDALQFAKDVLDAQEAVKDAKEAIKDLVDQAMGEKSNMHGVQSTTVVAKTKQQFGGSLKAKSVKPMVSSAVRNMVRAINVAAPEIGIILDVAIGFFDAYNTYQETGSLVSAALTFVSSMISSLPIIGNIWGVLTTMVEADESDGGIPMVTAIYDWAENILSVTNPVGAEMFKWLTGGAQSGSFWPAPVISGMTKVLSAASGVASAAASVIGGVVNDAITTVASVASSVGSTIVGAVKSVGSMIASAFCWWCRRDLPLEMASDLPSESQHVLKAQVLVANPLSAGGDRRGLDYGCLSTGTVYTATSGTVSDDSGNYSNNADCYWVISVPGTAITLTFVSLDTEANFDFVSVHSCPTAACASTTELPGSPFNGTMLPGPMVSSTGHMKIMFTSDGSVVGAGFVARYSTARIAGSAAAASKCSATGMVLTTRNGTLTDGPGDYDNYVDCSVVISLPGRTIHVKIVSLDTEEGKDLVRIESCISEACTSTTAIGGSPFSGSVPPAPMDCATGFVKISFTTDGSFTGAGFSMEYSSSEQVSEVDIDKYLTHVLSLIPEGATLGLSLKFAVTSDDTAGVAALHDAIGGPGTRRSGARSSLFSSESGWDVAIWGAVEIHSVSTTSLKKGLDQIEARKVIMPKEVTNSSNLDQIATENAQSVTTPSSLPAGPSSLSSSLNIGETYRSNVLAEQL